MDFHVVLKLRIMCILLLLFLIPACSSTINLSEGPNSIGSSNIKSLTIVPNQLPAPGSFKSIQLFSNESSSGPPIIELGSDDELTLSFDELTDINGQFRITFSHHNKNWGYSNIPQDWYLKGIGELIIGSGQISNSRGPDYIHYEAKISQKEIQFISSGNFLLHVSDIDTGQELFSLPFFVTEDSGELSSTSQTIFNSGNNFSSEHRLFSTYNYPENVEYPDFDLSFAYIQNRFWSDVRFTEFYEFNTPGLAKFELTQSKAFPANVDKVTKDLSDFSQNASDIIEWLPGLTPPRLILREDVINFLGSNSGARNAFRTYQPELSLRSAYANSLFRLEGEESLETDDEVYILGDFNQWTANKNSLMTFNVQSGYWETELLLKEGIYSYQYILLNNEEEISLTSLADNSSANVQEYMTLIYFNDPEYKYDRLLNIEVFYAR